MPFELAFVLCAAVLLFPLAHGANTIISVDTEYGDPHQYQSITLAESDLGALLQVNCTGRTDTLSMLYVTEAMYDDCTTPVADGGGGPPLNQIQCPDSSDNEVVDYSITLRPSLPNIVPFAIGETTYFAFYEGGSFGKFNNTPCTKGLKIAVHIQDPATVTTPTPTTTIAASSTSVTSTTATSSSAGTSTDTSVVSTSTTIISSSRTLTTSLRSQTTTSETSTSDRGVTPSRSDCITIEVVDANIKPTVLCTDPTTGRISGGASMVSTSLLSLLVAIMAAYHLC